MKLVIQRVKKASVEVKRQGNWKNRKCRLRRDLDEDCFIALFSV